jgi:hypothetical protein
MLVPLHVEDQVLQAHLTQVVAVVLGALDQSALEHINFDFFLLPNTPICLYMFEEAHSRWDHVLRSLKFLLLLLWFTFLEEFESTEGVLLLNTLKLLFPLSFSNFL